MTGIFDPSIIGHTSEEIESMSDEEREEACIDAINRAADIIQHAEIAFGDCMRPTERKAMQGHAKGLIAIARFNPDAD